MWCKGAGSLLLLCLVVENLKHGMIYASGSALHEGCLPVVALSRFDPSPGKATACSLMSLSQMRAGLQL